MPRTKSRQQQQRQSKRRNNCRRLRLHQRGGDAQSVSLASILPTNSFYPYNNNAADLPNPMDTRALQQHLAHAPIQRGGIGENDTRSRGRKRRSSTIKSKHINYAGRQIGCRTRARASSGRSGRSGRSRTRHGLHQSGGDSLNYLPSDANMVLRSASNFAGNLWAGLKGVQGAPSALPFEDQALQSEN
jgi:hypothetical protein